MDISKYFAGEVIPENEGLWIMLLDKPVSSGISVAEQINFFYQHGVLAGCNLVMAKMYGFNSKHDMVGLQLADMLPATPSNLEFLETFIRNNYQVSEAESKEIDKDGKPVYFLNSMEAIRENGIVVGAKGRQKILIK